MGSLRIQTATDRRALSAEEGTTPTVLGRERRLIVWIGAMMGFTVYTARVPKTQEAVI